MVFIIGVSISFFLLHLALSSPNIVPTNKYLIVLAGTIILTIHIHWYIITLLKWELSKCIITKKKVVIFQNTPFTKNDSTFIDIKEIDQIEKKEHGLIKNLLNFGEIQIYLAASSNSITIHNVPDPDSILNIINELRES
jgi:cytochrome c biogenesis protein CcdA